MIKARHCKPNSPEWIMAKFFNCWKRRAWMQMLGYVQSSWLARHKEPNRVLRLSLYTLVDTKFVQMNANTGVVAIFQVNIHRKLHTLDSQVIYNVRLVREGKKWGLDPKSII